MALQPLFCVPLDLGALSGGTAAAGHPHAHLNRKHSLGLTWKAGSGQQFVRGNLGSAKSIDFCAILSANAQAGTTFRLRLGDSQGEVDGTADYDSGAQTFIDPSITRDDGLYHSFFQLPAVHTKRWWRIDIGNHSGDFSAPILVLGKKIVPQRFYNYDHETSTEDLGALNWGRNGVPDYQPGRILRTKQFTLDWVTTTEWEEQFRPMAESLGTTGMVYCCFDPTANAYRQGRTYFGRMRKPLVERARRIPTRHGLDFEIVSII